jgi:hypothetical protein
VHGAQILGQRLDPAVLEQVPDHCCGRQRADRRDELRDRAPRLAEGEEVKAVLPAQLRELLATAAVRGRERDGELVLPSRGERLQLGAHRSLDEPPAPLTVAEQRRAANRAADRTDWDRTGATGTAAGLREYLEKHPDGQFAEQARATLSDKRQQSRAAAAAADREFWDRMVAADNVAAYNRYLDEQPKGAFRDEAAARIRQLQQAVAAQQDNSAAAATERQLALDPISLRLVEARLQQLGLQPGAVDGRIDGDTRGAIRRYQRDRQLTASGYLDQATVSQMLTDAFR